MMKLHELKTATVKIKIKREQKMDPKVNVHVRIDAELLSQALTVLHGTSDSK